VKQDRNVLLIFFIGIMVLLLAPSLGIEVIFPWEAMGETSEAYIFWKLRVPRVLTAFCAGAALALGGMIFQAMFRNPLATPFTLGVSSGAALGATLAIRLGLVFSILGVAGVTLSAFVGAFCSVVLVYLLMRMRPGSSTATMLLAGVAVNFTFSSLILMVHYSSDMSGSFDIMRWMMGNLEVVGIEPVFGLLPLVLLGGLLGLVMRRELDLMSLGDDIAQSRGVSIRNYRKILFVSVSLIVAAVVSICGPIGFIGMMAPHICRQLVGPDHQRLAPASLFFGGAFLVFCDVLARTLIAPAELPVGIITSLLGGPFFLWLLLTRNDGRNPREAG
jgi:cobalamin transport system permease protein